MRFKIPVKVEHEGNSYTGEYWTEKKVVYVEAYGPAGAFPIKCIPIGGSTSESLARSLLREMIEDGEVTPDMIG
jgi:hypothetical protein